MKKTDANLAIDNLFSWLQKCDFNYYSINSIPESKFLNVIQQKVIYGGVIVRQLFRLCPINFRRCFKSRDSIAYNPKATILLAGGLLHNTTIPQDRKDAALEMLLERIKNLNSQHCKNFAIKQNKTLFMLKYSAGNDEVACLLTAMAGVLFYEYWLKTKNEEYLALVKSIIQYFIEEHPKDEYPEGIYFRYDPKYKFVTYNASAFISGFMIMMGNELQIPEAIELGKKGIDFVIKNQNADGSWYYGKKGKYIDNFHSFIMIWAMQLAVCGKYAEAEESLNSGMKFWFDNFAARHPMRHFVGKLPLNSSLLQKMDLRDYSIPAVFFMKHANLYPEQVDFAKQLVTDMQTLLSNGKTFYPEKTWLWSNRIPYIEFQGWALLALSLKCSDKKI